MKDARLRLELSHEQLIDANLEGIYLEFMQASASEDCSGGEVA